MNTAGPRRRLDPVAIMGMRTPFDEPAAPAIRWGMAEKQTTNDSGIPLEVRRRPIAVEVVDHRRQRLAPCAPRWARCIPVHVHDEAGVPVKNAFLAIGVTTVV